MDSPIRNILLVEDNPQDLELTLMAMEEYHLISKILVVRNGAEALDYLYRRGKFATRSVGNPILVLLDLKMPKVSGLEVLMVIKSDEQLKTIPVVVLSSSRETLDLNACYHHGVNAYVVKPVVFAEFVNAVKHLGIFWATINEPLPPAGRAETLKPCDAASTRGRKEVNHEITTPHPALGR